MYMYIYYKGLPTAGRQRKRPPKWELHNYQAVVENYIIVTSRIIAHRRLKVTGHKTG